MKRFNFNKGMLAVIIAAIAVVAIVAATSEKDNMSGAATQSGNCEWSWPQKVIIGGQTYPCPSDRSFCNYNKAKQGLVECCADHSPYRNCISASQYAGCTDSDGGSQYSVFGTVTGVQVGTTNTAVTFADSCYSDIKLVERYCNGEFATTTTYDCTRDGKVCQAGACVVKQGAFCKWEWPQKVVVNGKTYSCSYDKPYCNNDKTKQGIGECCASYGPYQNCAAQPPPSRGCSGTPTPCSEVQVKWHCKRHSGCYTEADGWYSFFYPGGEYHHCAGTASSCSAYSEKDKCEYNGCKWTN